MTEVSSSIRDSRKSSVLTIESKTNEDKGPLEKDDLTGEEDENDPLIGAALSAVKNQLDQKTISLYPGLQIDY